MEKWDRHKIVQILQNGDKIQPTKKLPSALDTMPGGGYNNLTTMVGVGEHRLLKPRQMVENSVDRKTNNF